MTFSMHCEANIFSKRETSDYDVDLPAGTSDEGYLEALNKHLPPIFASVRPQLCFFQAGVDPHRSDRFGKLDISSSGLKRRNKVVLDLAAQHQCRVVLTAGGGYPKDLDPASEPFHNVVQAHADCYRMLVAAHTKLHWQQAWPWVDGSVS